MTSLRYSGLRHRLLADIDFRARSGRGATVRRYPDDRYVRPGAPGLTEHERYAMYQLDGWGMLATMHSGSGHLGDYVAPSATGLLLLAEWNTRHGDPKSEE